MSEAAVAEKPAASAGGNKMLLLLVLVVNVLIAGGLAYVVMSGQQKAAAPAKGEGHEASGEGHEGGEEGAAAAEEGGEEGHAPKKGGFGPLVEVGTFVANLTSSGGASRYAKVGLHVEATSEEAKVQLEGAVVPIRNEALLYLSGLNAEQAIGQEKIRALQDELLKRLQAVAGKNVVKRVYFSEFVIQ